MRKRDEMLEPYEGKPSRTVLRRESGSNPADLAGKIDSTTGKGIYEVPFLLYDSGKNPVGEYTTDDRGYIRIEGLAPADVGGIHDGRIMAASRWVTRVYAPSKPLPRTGY